MYFFLSNSDAHGKLFCCYDNHNEEEKNLVKLIKKMAREKYFFFGCDVKLPWKNGIKTFQEVENIYKNCKNDLCSTCVLEIYQNPWATLQFKIPPGPFDCDFYIDDLIKYISASK